MRDLTSSWPAVIDWPNAELDRNGIRARTVAIASQHLISGNLAAFAARAGVSAEGAGVFGAVTGERYSLRVARDRMLVVNGAAEAMVNGWHADGYALSDVSAMYHVFEFEGESLDDLIGEAMLIDPKLASPSAATTFVGQQAVVYRQDGKLRVHVERGFASFIWQWLEARD